MRRMIALADEPAEAGRRFREMVHAAIEQFNEGSYGRSLKMFDLARQMVEEGQVKAAFVEPMVVSGHEYLAEERVRKLAERPEGHFFLRPVLGFFRAYRPGPAPRRAAGRAAARPTAPAPEPPRGARHARARGRLGEAAVRPRGQRRRALLPAQPRLPAAGDPASRRRAVADRGGDRRAGDRSSSPGGRSSWSRKRSSSLVASRHPRAEGHLVAQLRGGRGGAPGAARVGRGPQGPARPPRPGGGGPRALRDPARVGRPRRARPRPGGLVRGPAVAPRGALQPGPVAGARRSSRGSWGPSRRTCPAACSARLVPGREATLTRLVAALASTRAPEVRELLSEAVASRFAGQAFGREAQEVLAALDQRAAAAPAAPSISGDLDLFGLPNLLQNLSRAREDGGPQPPRRERPPGRDVAPRRRA